MNRVLGPFVLQAVCLFDVWSVVYFFVSGFSFFGSDAVRYWHDDSCVLLA